MDEWEVREYYNNLPKETQDLITKVMFSTIDMCNDALKGKQHIVYFEAMAYKVFKYEMLAHMLNEEWFDALGDLTWKQKGEKQHGMENSQLNIIMKTMTEEEKEKLRKWLYNNRFTVDPTDDNPFVGCWFSHLVELMEKYKNDELEL